jgi:hypothetical protein
MSATRSETGTKRPAKPRSTTAKPRAATTTTPRKRASSIADISVSAEERQRMIREAAYYRAQRRGFAPGDAMADWLAAEAEVDCAIKSSDAK